MIFGVFGGFQISRKPNWHGVFDKTFWKPVDENDGGLPEAWRWYIFALQNGSNIIAWYVGKTEKRTFPARMRSANQGQLLQRMSGGSPRVPACLSPAAPPVPERSFPNGQTR
jgi:hypothetical protein